MDEIEGFWRIWGSQNYDEIIVYEKKFSIKKVINYKVRENTKLLRFQANVRIISVSSSKLTH